ncbi:zinc finger HIT domain-containing protein 2 [Topomyia yanbarensis]|uniref:zinc finger HIT domain-containing protein 2 n=1 Tax=Topomyia yanbarensis TaxID=2498891 RepID=UPI00273B4A21|nr:zinc finger HIT domain-containing protein 2 [Topomyia yanbarensis]
MDQDEICKICNAAPSKYCCPRCNVLYCSLSCYKSTLHQQCSEGFYKENVMQQMALDKDDEIAAQSSQSMVEILKRLEQTDEDCVGIEDEGESFDELDSDDCDYVPELAERLEGVDFDDPNAIWERLTEDERMEFQGMLESGDISTVLPEVEPWWLREYKIELVQPSTSLALSKGEEDLIQQCPSLRVLIKDFSIISSKEPSPLTKFNLCNILAAYAFVYRYFNGDFGGCSQEVSNLLISISGNLNANHLYESEEIAVESVCHQCLIEQLPADEDTSLTLKKDMTMFFGGPSNCGQKYRQYFLLAALSDIHRLFSKAKTYIAQKRALGSYKSEKDNGAFSAQYSDEHEGASNLELVTLKKCLKKIDYMLSYSKDYL